MKISALVVFLSLVVIGCGTILQYDAQRRYKEAGCCAVFLNEDATCYYCKTSIDEKTFLYWENSWEKEP